MFEDRLSSDESEGAFNDFIDERLESLTEDLLNGGTLENLADRGSDIIVELDNIEPPRFIYDSPNGGGEGSGEGGQQPGQDGGKIRFILPFNRIMELLGKKLNLPNLRKEGEGRIKKYTEEHKTFGPLGVLLDKKRTFKRALKTNIAQGTYDPRREKYDLQIMRRDKRFKQFQVVEKPKFKAVVFYMGDISYSTQGERLDMEKRLINIIQNWIDYNYGAKNVDHRFFVHDVGAYEVNAEDFYKVSNAGGTRASVVFDLVSQIALSEYNPGTTNFYGFYFGDGELFEEDQKEVIHIVEESMRPYFNRIGIVEIMPSHFSSLNKHARSRYPNDRIVRLAEIKQKAQTLQIIKAIFGEVYAQY